MSQTIKVDFGAGRASNADKEWELPPWGHPVSLCVFPLFYGKDDRVLPVGTAFQLGGGVHLCVTASHCIDEAIRQDPILHHDMQRGVKIEGRTLQNTSLYVMRNWREGEDRLRVSFVPIENITGAPPTDLLLFHPQFVEGDPSVEWPVSLKIPNLGKVVHTVGYTDFSYPANGIHLSTQFEELFQIYSHRLVVIEAEVRHVFTQKFAAGYVGGPCFTFGGSLHGGMSGGPIFDLSEGTIIGVNSATCSGFFDEPTSIGSMIYPMVMNRITFGANIFGDPRFRVNSSQHIVEMMEFGSILTDGSHEDLTYTPVGDDLYVGNRLPEEGSENVFEDFGGYQRGEKPRKLTSKYFVRKQNNT